ncbi:sigma-70 family RNA polymerase sigma factor [Reyranella sp.]|uniref:sigma-70 family RNA polymerase sigma factor n=1 Tax=Reyranella sp. TaxID=1929291 RepID=UPI003BAC76D9
MGNERTLRLYLDHRVKLVEYANGIVRDPGRAEDVVQEAFLRFKGATPERLLDEPVGYLYRIVRNLALDRRRRSLLEKRYFQDGAERIAEAVPEGRPSPEQELIDRQTLRRVFDALEALPERTRIALEMHRFGGCTLKEIAEHLGISVSMAQVLVAEGVRHCMRSL